MHWARAIVVSILAGALPGVARAPEQEPATTAAAAARQDPTIKALVDRLDLEKYKATIKGLTQFGDRRQGTDRNRAALDWIEAQLKSYGCANTERITYQYLGRQLTSDSTFLVDSAAAVARKDSVLPRRPGQRGGGGRGAAVA